MLLQPWIVLAEIINFLVLIALLQRFLYQPIMQAMAKRERSIADRIQSAENKESEAQALIEQYTQLQTDWIAQFKHRQQQMLQQLEAEKTENLDRIRADLETHRTQWHEALRQEQKAYLVTLRDRARLQLIQTVRDALQTLADTTLEAQMIKTFLHRLPTLSAAERDTLLSAAAKQEHSPSWIIRTTFPLNDDLQTKVIQGIRSVLLPQVSAENFTFEIYPDYPCGIELRTEGYKLSWHLEHYLNSLESQLAYTLDQVPVL